ncbi:MAG: hypothetical protein HN833_02490 [Elusimicrobiaceae bacterium]|jgi:hypothetical protein|nr:hypothetical protein [Elusimicrobiaceae bacterium]MBT3954839.1 hypothetical protein [Elusimicrobiaceae bacterium]MBT4008414.1 hypothetical protein [Elusimicrobiaceae bacterium]MBT4402942.1 hypothetical protein [Elusimicrobiaceae bacterium]MBT4439878.1 hypothetical protein [Elusimicrobiaceae bacterium]
MNLWILTEERPKKKVLETMLSEFAKDKKIGAFGSKLQILPILKNGEFNFTYEVIGFRCNIVDKIYIKIVSGYSSFVDFLVFHQEKEPTQKDTPLYIIEETKTDDKESRNTGVYQRCSKFVLIEKYYPNVKKIMLYNLQVEQKEKPTKTSIFGTRLLLTLGVEILGKKLDKNIFKPFTSVEELIKVKSEMKKPNKTNVPILINKKCLRITVSGRLFKSNGLSYDPNIGALSIISAVLRKLGWNRNITITHHGLKQKHLTPGNKFISIANDLGINIDGLKVPKSKENKLYWKYDKDGEKLGTIFIHIVVDNFTKGESIFENHAGCEKGYFLTAKGEHIPLQKYSDREKYKAGDKSKIVHIPDLILIDFDRSEIINIEGKKYQFRANGIQELKNYNYIEKNYIKKHYPKFKIKRTVILYGSTTEKIIEIEVGFLLNENGKLVLGVKAPDIFKEAIKNLIDFWGKK